MSVVFVEAGNRRIDLTGPTTFDLAWRRAEAIADRLRRTGTVRTRTRHTVAIARDAVVWVGSPR